MCCFVFLRFAFFKVLPGDYEILATHPTWALTEVSSGPCLCVCYSLETNVEMNLGCEMKSQFLEILGELGCRSVGVIRVNSPPQQMLLLLVSSLGDACEVLMHCRHLMHCHRIELSQHQKFPVNLFFFCPNQKTLLEACAHAPWGREISNSL